MTFAIYGAGAVGSFLGARLIEAGHRVHFIARGATLPTLRRRGLLIQSKVFGTKKYWVHVTGAPNTVGPVDYVVLGVKAGALHQIARRMMPLNAPNTRYISIQNGLPWWYFHGVPGDERPIRAVDPDGVIGRNILPSRVIGAIVYFSCSVSAPGEVIHSGGTRLPLGEPGGGRTPQVLALSSALQSVGLKAPVRHDIRHELWVKLLGNAALNPLSALTRKTLGELIDSPHGLRLIEAMMDEIRDVAAAVGVRIAISNERRIAGARANGSHRTSMLQDLERGREPELEAILGAVIELAKRNHVPVPVLSTVDSATRVLFGGFDG